MSDVRMPIVTTIEGNKITKICVEDVYKIINRIIDALNNAYNNSTEIIESLDKDTGDLYKDTYKGTLIIGTGTSQPCLTDAFDEEIGKGIAFSKAKLNANIKKHNFLVRIWNELEKAQSIIDNDLIKVDNNIIMDLDNVRIYNTDYLTGIEKSLGI